MVQKPSSITLTITSAYLQHNSKQNNNNSKYKNKLAETTWLSVKQCRLPSQHGVQKISLPLTMEGVFYWTPPHPTENSYFSLILSFKKTLGLRLPFLSKFPKTFHGGKKNLIMSIAALIIEMFLGSSHTAFPQNSQRNRCVGHYGGGVKFCNCTLTV